MKRVQLPGGGLGNGTYEWGTASLFRLAANKDLLMFGCHHDTVWLRRGPQSSRPGQSVPPTDSLGCHRPPLGRSSTTSFPSNNSKKGVLKYQQASRDHGKQLLNLLLLPEHISFLEGEGPSTQQGEKLSLLPHSQPTRGNNPSLSTDTAETATRTPGRWEQGFEASEAGSAFLRSFGCKKQGLDVSSPIFLQYSHH